MLRLGSARAYPPGESLLRYGDRDNHVVLLLDGVVKVVVDSAVGKEAVLAVRVGGDLVGELAAIDGGARSATVIACGHVRTRVVGRVEFDAFLRRSPDTAHEISRMITERLRWSDRRRVDFVARSAAGRLAKVLLEIADGYGRVVDDGCELDVSLTQVELGSLAGLAKRTVEKHMADLQAAKLIEARYRHIRLLDVVGLREVAGLST
ncbi:Crp/Fnr family transcriptional regulator [Saccharothrix hoggarensis]|uniref:Crp/Fnr family transcriptional regulator n=1 Tax=Saccharothrix hoggarensis TaxID=913853 RepID=A0ABW3R461_9PSEU